MLGEFIEKALMGIPFLAVEIPLLGSPANLIGMLMGAIVCGVIGAIAINLINKYVAEQQKRDNLDAQVEKKTEVLSVQEELIDVKERKLRDTQQRIVYGMIERHKEVDERLEAIKEDAANASVAEMQNMNNEELSRLLQKINRGKNQ